MKAHPVAWLVLRILFGGFFIVSGVLKIISPINFTDSVRNFEIVGDPIAAGIALFVPWVEVVAGAFLISGIFAVGASGILLASLIVFTTAIISAWARNMDISCGCLGGTGPINYPLKITENAALIAVAWLLWRHAMKCEKSRR